MPGSVEAPVAGAGPAPAFVVQADQPGKLRSSARALIGTFSSADSAESWLFALPFLPGQVDARDDSKHPFRPPTSGRRVFLVGMVEPGRCRSMSAPLPCRRSLLCVPESPRNLLWPVSASQLARLAAAPRKPSKTVPATCAANPLGNWELTVAITCGVRMTMSSIKTGTSRPSSVSTP